MFKHIYVKCLDHPENTLKISVFIMETSELDGLIEGRGIRQWCPVSGVSG